MKAVVFERYGPPDVLHLAQLPTPVPKRDELLIKIHATTVNRLDCHTGRRTGATAWGCPCSAARSQASGVAAVRFGALVISNKADDHHGEESTRW